MRPAPVSSASVNVSSATTRPEVSQRARAPPDWPRPPSFISSLRFVLETCSAGASPNTMPVARQITAKYPNTAKSRLKTIQYGLPTSATAASNNRTPTAVEAQPEQPAKARQHDALDEELPHDSSAARAERRAHGHLARPVRGARQQQVGHVRARNQQDESDRAEQRQEHQADGSAVEALVERHQPRFDVLVVLGISRLQLLRDGRHLDRGLCPA